MKVKDLIEKVKAEKKLMLIIVLSVVGIACLSIPEIWSGAQSKAATQEVQTETDFLEHTEKRLQEVLSKVEGAGRVEVMLTLDSSDEKVYASNKKQDTRTAKDTVQKNVQEEYVLSGHASDGRALLLKTNAPRVKGVIAVCDGADNPKVEKAIVHAVSASLGIGPNRISVIKMKTETESAYES